MGECISHFKPITFLSSPVAAPLREIMCTGNYKRTSAIENIEKNIIERGFVEGWIKPQPPVQRPGKNSSPYWFRPAGLAAAQQLNRAGHTVTVLKETMQ
jgi:glutamate synthase (NADPH/NADH) small chain